MLYSQHFTPRWKLLGLVSRIEKSGTGDNNSGKWKGTVRSDRPKWPDRSQWTTFKAGPEYSGRTKPKWSGPFDEPTEKSGLLGWMESAPGLESENWQCFSHLLSRHFPPFFDPACCNVSRAGYNCSSVSRSGYIWFYSRPCDQASANGSPCLIERKSRNITNKNMLPVWLYWVIQSSLL